MIQNAFAAAAKLLARPYVTYAAGTAVAVGVFVPWVPVDKLVVAATLAAGLGALRSLDKRAAGAAGLA